MPEPVTGVTPATTYTVVSGDNLSKIAKKVHISASELAAANDIKPNATLRPGQKLIVPGKSMGPTASAAMDASAAATPAPAAKTEPAARASGEVLKHTVKSGETLGAIAKKYEVKVADIAVANNISDPAKIKPGQELIIPGWDPKSGGKAGKSAKSAGAAKKTEEPKSLPVEQSVVQPSPPPIIPVTPVDDNPIKPAPRP
jgi:LysM repeat protein